MTLPYYQDLALKYYGVPPVNISSTRDGVIYSLRFSFKSPEEEVELPKPNQTSETRE